MVIGLDGLSLLSSIRRLISFRRRQQLLVIFPLLRRLVETRLRIGGIDWQQTQVYAALDRMALWVNLQGRQADLICQRNIGTHNRISGWRLIQQIKMITDAYSLFSRS